MNITKSELSELLCPRCLSKTIDLFANSPLPDVWTVYGCHTCFYVWRSTEPEENTNPDKYLTAFKIKPEDLSKFIALPEIPPLRKGQ
jgi:hypothetical protein